MVGRLAAFDVYIWDQCYSMEQSLRIDFVSYDAEGVEEREWQNRPPEPYTRS